MTPKQLIKHPVHFLSFGFGTGLSPFAPGTFGTIVAIPMYLFAANFGSIVVLACCIVICISGIYLCEQTTRALGKQDHPAIVWDEIAGFFVTMLFVPASWLTVLAGFAFFRLFDIFKPWPIFVIDSRVKGGLGVMLDDIMAGLFALLCMHILLDLNVI